MVWDLRLAGLSFGVCSIKFGLGPRVRAWGVSQAVAVFQTPARIQTVDPSSGFPMKYPVVARVPNSPKLRDLFLDSAGGLGSPCTLPSDAPLPSSGGPVLLQEAEKPGAPFRV